MKDQGIKKREDILPVKVQTAMLEAMQEKQVSIVKQIYPLDKPSIRMMIKKILFVLTALILLCSGAVWVTAEPRNIYIGDIITLQISSRGLSAEELIGKFQAFEILEIKDENASYLISLRTFEVGEHKILLGDKEIVINVQSVLDNIQREGIFEGDTGVMEPGYLFKWNALFYIAAGLFVLSGGYVLTKALLKGVIVTQSPYQVFLRRSGSLSVENDDYFVDLTFYFKEYLEGLYQFRIIGKTSAEIVNELKGINLLNTMLPEINEWLTECDRLKFTGVNVSTGTKQEHYEKLLKLVEKIDAQGLNSEETS